MSSIYRLSEFNRERASFLILNRIVVIYPDRNMHQQPTRSPTFLASSRTSARFCNLGDTLISLDDDSQVSASLTAAGKREIAPTPSAESNKLDPAGQWARLQAWPRRALIPLWVVVRLPGNQA
jgi:hypothetical protein